MAHSTVLNLGNPLLTEHFEKDLKFLELFLLLFNQSCPIKRIDLKWAEEGPTGRAGLRAERLSTEVALAGPCGHLLACDSVPEPMFCNVVHDRGRHETESCGTSDHEAETRVRRTRKPEVYRCHAGLVDIAVPVIANGRYIATLFTGQILREPPTRPGFIEIQKQTAHLTYIKRDELEKAYWKVPVVTDEDIERTVQLLEVFAEYLGVIWVRLSELVREQERRMHELNVARKEFALTLLEGESANGPALRELMRQIGLSQHPTRVLVVAFEADEKYRDTGSRYDVACTQGLQAVEELCAGLTNICCAYLRNHGLCVFFRDRGPGRGDPSGTDAQALAARVLQALTLRCPLRARVGIGRAKTNRHELSGSYHEARVALAGSTATIATYAPSSTSDEEVFAAVDRICSCMMERRLNDARLQVLGLPVLVNRRPAEQINHVETQRHFFVYALDAMRYTARELGSRAVTPGDAFASSAALSSASTAFDLQARFVQSAETLLNSVRNLYVGRPQMLVHRAVQLIEESLEDRWKAQSLTIGSIASSIGISADHLSRLFKKSTGYTFERYLMMRRVEAARRLLLEPLATVAQVAEALGFSDPAYFTRVFRKISGCSPSAYRNDPLRAGGAPAHRLAGAGSARM